MPNWKAGSTWLNQAFSKAMRIRTIKPEFFNHTGIYDLEVETSLPIRIAFAGLWCAADREGRFRWEPRRLGVQILPYDQVDFSRVLDALATRGFVVKYASKEGEFGYIPSFTRHQVINNREKASELPNPNDCNGSDACPTRAPRVPHASEAEGKGREGKGKEGSVGDTRPHEVPKLEAVKQYAASAPFPISDACAIAFHDTQEAAGWITKHGHSIADWRAALRRYASAWNENEKSRADKNDPRKQKSIIGIPL